LGEPAGGENSSWRPSPHGIPGKESGRSSGAKARLQKREKVNKRIKKKGKARDTFCSGNRTVNRPECHQNEVKGACTALIGNIRLREFGKKRAKGKQQLRTS